MPGNQPFGQMGGRDLGENMSQPGKNQSSRERIVVKPKRHISDTDLWRGSGASRWGGGNREVGGGPGSEPFYPQGFDVSCA
jgi:hypothetical protein